MPAPRSAILCGMIIAGAVLGSLGVQAYLIVPLQRLEKDSLQKRAELRQRLALARDTIEQVRELELDTAQARRSLNNLLGEHPQSSALVWLPKMVEEHFNHRGLVVTVIRLNAIREASGLSGYQQIYWSAAFPLENDGASVGKLLRAVTDLEEQNRYLKVIDFAIRPDVENPLLRTGAINFVALVQK